MAATGLSGKIGSNGSSHFDRINRYGRANFFRGENFSEGITNGEPLNKISAMEVLLNLFEDSNSMYTLLNPNYKEAAVYMCNHPKEGFITDIVYSDPF